MSGINETLIKHIKDSGMSIYRLSKSSGVPYSVLNDLANGKKDINNCSAETVVRIAGVLDADIYEILNPIYMMDRVSGKYKGISYEWKKEDSMVLYLKECGKETVIKSGHLFKFPKDMRAYRSFTKFYINKYLKKEEFKKKVEKYRKERNYG